MASGFPGSIDNFTDPLSNSPLNSPSHSTLHADVNDAVEKIETYMGLVKVIPTSVTGGTLAANGTITIGTAVASVVVSGAFSSLYDNYRIIVTGGTASANASGSLQLTGSTGATYQMYGYYNDFGTATLTAYSPTAATSWTDALRVSTVAYQATIELNGPNLARATLGWTQTHSTTTVYNFALRDTSTTQATGFTVAPQAGTTITGGTIRVYGYRN